MRCISIIRSGRTWKKDCQYAMACNFPCRKLGGLRWTQRPGLSVTSATHTPTPLVVNRCQPRTTVCMCVRCVSQACWGLGSISGALSLNLVLMWPMRLLRPLCPVPIIHNPVEHFSSVYTPAPAPLTFLYTTPCSKNLHVHTNFPFLLFVFVYPVRLVGNMYDISFWQYCVSHIHTVKHFSTIVL